MYINDLKSKGENAINALDDSAIDAMENNSDIYFRYVLSTLTGLKKLSVGKISNLTKIDFLNTVKNLSELDYRGTNVTDVTILNTNGLRIGTLFTNGKETDLATIETTLNRMESNRDNDSELNNVWNDTIFNGVMYGGLNIEAYVDSKSAFAKCNNVESLVINGNSGALSFDMSNCVSLQRIYLTNCRCLLPEADLKYVFLYGSDCEPDFSNVKSIKTLEAPEAKLRNFVSTLSRNSVGEFGK